MLALAEAREAPRTLCGTQATSNDGRRQEHPAQQSALWGDAISGRLLRLSSSA